MKSPAATLLLLALGVSTLHAEDWPEWRGRGRDGVWKETGIMEKFPTTGLKIRWRAPIRGGYTGPAVAEGRVFVADFDPGERRRGKERALCLDEHTGKLLWEHTWETGYDALQPTYAIGPRATPTVDGDRVYFLGGAGALHCLDAKTGAPRWARNYITDFQTRVPIWGIAGAPLVVDDRLICLVGGQPDAKVVAFDKRTGRELWRALDGGAEMGYGQPIVIQAGGARQIIMWTPQAIVSLDPATGRVLWQEAFPLRSGLAVATPVVAGNRLFVSAFYNGSLMLELDPTRPAARVAWRRAGSSEQNTDALHALITTPVIEGDHLYGICSYGQFRCVDARNGERVWETPDVTREKARWAAGFIVRNGNRHFINNDRGELIIARLSPKGYEELSRTTLLKPTTPGGGTRRELGAVNWSHPAYANRHIYARNDQEIISASLAR